MNINLVEIDANKTVGKNPVLVDVAPSYVYESGKRTGEVSGFKYTVALPDKAFEKLTVKIDGYHGQSVLVFEEFASQIPIEDMLNYLDIYPLMLSARFNDKVACYDMVYITSNISLGEQYSEVQYYKPETWKAFLRRINFLVEYTDVNTYTVTKINNFFTGTVFDEQRKNLSGLLV